MKERIFPQRPTPILPTLFRGARLVSCACVVGSQAGTAVAGEAGKLTEEIWTGISGYTVATLTSNASFPAAPASVGKLAGVEPASNIGDHYGRRLRGWITAPATGDYTFWIAGDDNCELWLSPDATSASKQKIAAITGNGACTTFRQYDKYASQKSAVIPLVQGRKYYLEVLHKENDGGDHLSLAWQPPGLGRQVVPATVIDAFEADPNDQDDDGLPDDWEQTHGLSSDAATGASGQNGPDGDPDGDGFTNRQEWLGQSSPVVHGTLPGGLKREVWYGIAGTTVASLTGSDTFYKVPHVDEFLPGAAAPVDSAENYGQRLRGYVTIPATGVYRFYVAGDDDVELRLATDGSPFSKQRAAFISNGWTLPEQWTKYATQKSAEYTLQQGQLVYVEILQKEGVGGDHVSLGWSVGGSAPVKIPAANLQAYAILAEDQDDDGLADAWEQAHGFDLSDNGLLHPDQRPTADPDGDGFTNFLEMQSDADPFAEGGNRGYVRRDIWTGLPAGFTLMDWVGGPLFPKPADDSSFTAGGLDFGRAGDLYGQRIQGLIVPPRTGNWRFWLASDDSSRFLLSTTASAIDKRQVASLDGYVAPGNYDARASQRSDWMALSAGTPYYFEILHQDLGGDDHLSLAWAYQTENWALAAHGSTAIQSGAIPGDYAAAKAIDGDTTPTRFSHTNDAANSWWQVDFGQNRPINRVVVVNRDILQERLSNFRISALDSAGNELSGQDCFTGSGHAGATFTWDLPATVQARKVKIQLLGTNNTGNGYLTLAEVQAYEWVPEADRQVVAAQSLRTALPDPLDADGDSLPDAWELQVGLDPADNGALDFANGEYGDPDLDQVTNRDEYLLGTAPVTSDSDGDGLPDEWERFWFGGLDETAGGDHDRDGVSNLAEFQQGGVPRLDPTDTDGDGLPDAWETRWFGDPSIHTGIDDPDDDGMDNAYEFAHATNPNDFFNGETPVLRVAGGDGEVVTTGTWSDKPLRVTVKRPNGEPYLNAAVTFRTIDGYAGLAGDVAESTVRTTAEGAGIAFRAPAAAGTTLITASLSTGQSVTLRVYAVNPSSQIDATTGKRKPPIRNFKETQNPDGTITYTWVSDADNGDWFQIEDQQADGSWKPVFKTTYGSAILPYVPGMPIYSLTLNPATDFLP